MKLLQWKWLFSYYASVMLTKKIGGYIRPMIHKEENKVKKLHTPTPGNYYI